MTERSHKYSCAQRAESARPRLFGHFCVVSKLAYARSLPKFPRIFYFLFLWRHSAYFFLQTVLRFKGRVCTGSARAGLASNFQFSRWLCWGSAEHRWSREVWTISAAELVLRLERFHRTREEVYLKWGAISFLRRFSCAYGTSTMQHSRGCVRRKKGCNLVEQPIFEPV